MIPLKISIENFMCYRGNVPTLSLESIHVACLSGNNGHGKTALLDSITWALWGKSRARTQEELIHQGQRNMRVELEFMAQDQRYKVTRIYGKTNRSSTGKTELNLSVLLGTDYTSIMGNTIREMGNHDKAMDIFTASLKQAEELGDKHGMGDSFNSIGAIYFHKGDFDKALECSNKSIAIADDLNDKYRMAISLNNNGVVSHNKGDYEEGLLAQPV